VTVGGYLTVIVAVVFMAVLLNASVNVTVKAQFDVMPVGVYVKEEVLADENPGHVALLATVHEYRNGPVPVPASTLAETVSPCLTITVVGDVGAVIETVGNGLTVICVACEVVVSEPSEDESVTVTQ
jgi:hypothetical protein